MSDDNLKDATPEAALDAKAGEAPDGDTNPSETDKALKADKKKTEKALKEEPKVKIRLPKDPLNKGNTHVPVVVNGYAYQIERGKDVEVPETVRDILEDSGYL